MIAKLIDLLFGCAHKRTTFPQSSRGAAAPYVVCLACGREFGYDWNTMRVATAYEARTPSGGSE